MAITGLTYNSQHNLNTGNTTPHGMTRVPSEVAARKLWIANNSDDQIYKYSDAVAYNTKVALPSGNNQPRGFAYDTKRDEVVSLNQSGHIYRITPSTGASPGTYSLNAGNTTGEGILYFESLDEFWVVDESDNQFYRYRGDTGAYISTINLNSGNQDARGACFVAGEAWVLNGSDKRVYRYDSTGSYQGRFDLNSAHQTPRAMAKVGSKLFVADNGNDKIFDYTITGSPVIAAIASPLNFVVDTAIDFEVRVDLATKVEIEADWEGLYYDWDANNGKLHIEGTPDRLATGESFTITATAADASTTTATGTYNVVSPAPIITEITGRVKFVRGKKVNLFIPVANTPINANVKGLIIGADHHLEDTGIQIKGDIPANANFTTTSGTFDTEVRNSGGTDTETGIPFDLLTTEPAFGPLTTEDGKQARISWSAVTDARGYAVRYKTEDDVEYTEWIDIGTTTQFSIPQLTLSVTKTWTTATVSWTKFAMADSYAIRYKRDTDTDFSNWIDIGDVAQHTVTLAAGKYDIEVRINSPWIGTTATAQVFVGVRFATINTADAQVAQLNVFGITDENTGDTLSAPDTWTFPSGWDNGISIRGLAQYTGTKFAIYYNTGYKLGIFDSSGITVGGSFSSPDEYILPSGYHSIDNGLTHYTGTKFALLDYQRNALDIYDIAGKSSGDTLDTPDNYLLPSGWYDPRGVAHYTGTKFAIIDKVDDRLGIFDISGLNSGDTLPSPDYYNLPPNWDNQPILTHYTGTKFILAQTDTTSPYHNIAVVDVAGLSNDDDLPILEWYSLSSDVYRSMRDVDLWNL